MNKLTQNYKEKAVIYVRVSSKGQEDGYSFDAQEKMCKDYAERNNLLIQEIWRGTESAWGKKERNHFNNMIQYIKKHPEIKHIIFDIEDRMTRNYRDKLKIDELVLNRGITVHFARNNNTYAPNADPNKKFTLNIAIAVSEKLSDDISLKTKMGMTEKAEQGIYPAKASLGYKNVKKDGEALIEVDPIAGPLITKLFEYAATGKYSYQELEEIFYKKGLRTRYDGKRVTLKSIEKVLHNPFYYGVFQWGRKLYPGTHKALVTKELWDEVQEVVRAKGHRFDTKHNYPFNRLITCEHCGHYILGALAKQKYLYYRCAHHNKNHKNGYLKENELMTRLSSIVKDIELPKDVVKILIKGLKQRGVKANRISANTKIILEQDLKRVKSRMDNLLDMRLDGKIDDFTYQAKNNKLIQERAKIESDLATCEGSPEGAERAIQGLEILSGLEKCYNNADSYGKADLLRAIGANFVLTKDNQIAVEYKEPFKGIFEAKINNGSGGNSPLPNEKTALLNKGCLNTYDDNLTKNASKSCSRNYWGG